MLYALKVSAVFFFNVFYVNFNSFFIFCMANVLLWIYFMFQYYIYCTIHLLLLLLLLLLYFVFSLIMHFDWNLSLRSQLELWFYSFKKKMKKKNYTKKKTTKKTTKSTQLKSKNWNKICGIDFDFNYYSLSYAVLCCSVLHSILWFFFFFVCYCCYYCCIMFVVFPYKVLYYSLFFFSPRYVFY